MLVKDPPIPSPVTYTGKASSPIAAATAALAASRGRLMRPEASRGRLTRTEARRAARPRAIGSRISGSNLRTLRNGASGPLRRLSTAEANGPLNAPE
jgi:hypothetical protein